MDSTSFGEVLLWSLWFFIMIAAIMIWFRVIVDMFSDHTLSGLGKAGWALVLIFVPWLGAFIYLIARGKSMNERQMAAVSDQQAAQAKYIQSVAATTTTPTEQIASAKELLDAKAISQVEFEALKAKALA